MFTMNAQELKRKLNDHLKAMHLPAIRKNYEDIIRRVEKENHSYELFLYELLECEYESRFNNKVARLLRESKLPLEKSLENFQMKRLTPQVKTKVKSLLNGDFLDRRENVLAFGNSGSGKTHLLCAICQELIKQGKRVYFTDCQLLTQELLIAKRELRLPKVIKNLSKYEAIFIDDIGYVQQERNEMEVLFTFLSSRYEQGSVLLTSNLPFSKWEAIFKDPVITAAAIDRLVHHSVIIEMNYKSFRLEEAQKKV